MIEIDVDFDVYKALTMRRASESVTYNEVIRDLLGLGGTPPPAAQPVGGCFLKGVNFPEGTQFRANYKGKVHTAEIKGGAWVDSTGVPRNSPSEAAHAITGTNVNGWRFWEVKRPADGAWRSMSDLR